MASTMNLYSRIDPTQLLHIIVRKSDVKPGRTDIIPTDQFLQVAALRQPNGVTYRPHKHNRQHRDEPNWLAQESWVVIQGLVQVTLYDIDDTVLHTDVLEPGDISVTLAGGHTYLFMAEQSLVYEYKVGKYIGVENDKTFLP